jgi:hypothetical protein
MYSAVKNCLLKNLLILLAPVWVCAQQKDVGSWHTINVQLTTKNKWMGFAELQTRSRKPADQFYYYEIKGGVGYKVLPGFSALLAVGRYATYSGDDNYEKPLSGEEFRMWQQLSFNDRLGRLKVDHRLRAEQRFMSNAVYRNRFRYRLNIILPLGHKPLAPRSFYLTSFDEIFLTNKAPHFERNRIFGGGGYVCSEVVTLQAGYLYQYDYSPAITTGKHFIHLSLLLQLNPSDNSAKMIELAD